MRQPINSLRAHWGEVTDGAAVFVALLILIAGLLLVIVPSVQAFQAVGNQSSSCLPLLPPCDVTVVTTVEPGGSHITRTVAPLALQDRLLAGGATVVFEVILTLLAAFVAGGVTQRTLRGEFEITLGPLSMPKLAARTSEVMEDLQGRTDELKEEVAETRTWVAQAATGVESLRELSSQHGAKLAEITDWAAKLEAALREQNLNLPA